MIWNRDKSVKPHEATYLKLDSSKARARLNWKPRWDLDRALEQTVNWHLAWRKNEDMRRVTNTQIDEYIVAGAEI